MASSSSSALTRHRYVALSKPLMETRTGRLLVATDRVTGERVVLKFVFANNATNNGLSHELLRETAVWALISAAPVSASPSCSSSPILQLRDVFSSGANVVFASLCADTDLHCLLERYGRQQRVRRRMPISEAKLILTQLARALDVLHREHGVAHRDIKPANVMIRFQRTSSSSSSSSPSPLSSSSAGDDDDDKVVVSAGNTETVEKVQDVLLADFGLSRFMASAGQRMTHEVVTRAYRPPELLLGCCCYSGSSVDMWSFGCLAVDVVSGIGSAPLFASNSDLDQLRRIFDVIGSPSPKVQKMLQHNHHDNNNNNNDNDGSDHNNISNNIGVSASLTSSSSSSSPEFSFASRPAKKNWAKTLSRGLPHGADFFERLLCHDPCRRMTAGQVLEHPFLASLNDILEGLDEAAAVGQPTFVSNRQELETLLSLFSQ